MAEVPCSFSQTSVIHVSTPCLPAVTFLLSSIHLQFPFKLTFKWGIEDFKGSENTLYDAVMMTRCHHTLVQTHRMCKPKRESRGERGPWVTATSWCRLTHWDTCPAQWGHRLQVGGHTREISVPPSQCCCGPKTAANTYILHLKKRKNHFYKTSFFLSNSILKILNLTCCYVVLVLMKINPLQQPSRQGL